MYKENQMMVMHTAGQDCKVVYEVDLHRKCIRIFFEVHFINDGTSSSSSAESSPGGEEHTGEPDVEVHRKGNRVDKFKFEVPFIHLEHFLECQNADDPHQKSYIIPLACPPKYFRQLKDWKRSMEPASGKDQPNYWSIHDVWMRQTGIEYDMVAPKSSPVSLKQKKPVIDIGKYD